METIAVALIVGVIGPVIMASLANRHRRAEREEDRADRAQVAADVAAVQVALAESDGATSQKLAELHDQGVEIHGLVNSNLSTAKAAELAARRSLAEVWRAEVDPSPERVAELADLEAAIAALEAEMSDRRRIEGESAPT